MPNNQAPHIGTTPNTNCAKIIATVVRNERNTLKELSKWIQVHVH